MIDLGKDDRKARGLGKRAERVKDASGGKKPGSLRKGNLVQITKKLNIFIFTN